MKTNLLQRQLHINASLIQLVSAKRHAIKQEAKAAQMKESRKQLYASARKMGVDLCKMADIQRDIKRVLLASKMARVQVYKKHGKDDARYTAWLEGKQAAERSGANYAPVEFFPPAESSVSCSC